MKRYKVVIFLLLEAFFLICHYNIFADPIDTLILESYYPPPNGYYAGNIAASANVGIGITAPNSSLQVNGSVATSVTSAMGPGNYNATAQDGVILASGGPTINLPDSTLCKGRMYSIKNIDVYLVTVSTSGSDRIDGFAYKELAAQYDKLQVVSDGAGDWMVVD